jgi:putative PIN family toxin of toxin-antitoxin system
MIRVVIDTNVLVSALLSSQGPNAEVLDLVLAGKLQPCITEEVLSEYRGVLGRPKFHGIGQASIKALIDLLETVSARVRPTATLKISSDEPDNRIYECAAAAGARYIITGNRRHFEQPYGSIEVVNARELLDLLGNA